jgi:hypothetical protein
VDRYGSYARSDRSYSLELKIMIEAIRKTVDRIRIVIIASACVEGERLKERNPPD